VNTCGISLTSGSAPACALGAAGTLNAMLQIKASAQLRRIGVDIMVLLEGRLRGWNRALSSTGVQERPRRHFAPGSIEDLRYISAALTHRRICRAWRESQGARRELGAATCPLAHPQPRAKPARIFR